MGLGSPRGLPSIQEGHAHTDAQAQAHQMGETDAWVPNLHPSLLPPDSGNGVAHDRLL